MAAVLGPGGRLGGFGSGAQRPTPVQDSETEEQRLDNIWVIKANCTQTYRRQEKQLRQRKQWAQRTLFRFWYFEVIFYQLIF